MTGGVKKKNVKMRGSSSLLWGSHCNCLHAHHFHIKRHHLPLVVCTGPAGTDRMTMITPDPRHPDTGVYICVEETTT